MANHPSLLFHLSIYPHIRPYRRCRHHHHHHRIAIHGNLSSKINLETTHTHIPLGTWHPFLRLDLITFFSWPDLDSTKNTSTINHQLTSKNGNYGIYFYSSTLDTEPLHSLLDQLFFDVPKKFVSDHTTNLHLRNQTTIS